MTLLHDHSIRKSLDGYVRRRIREIPSDLCQELPNTKQVWRCTNEADFLYGYYVGKIEEGALHYLLKAARASPEGFDTFEIRGIIEGYREQLKSSISEGLAEK